MKRLRFLIPLICGIAAAHLYTGCSTPPKYPLDADLVAPAIYDLCMFVEGLRDGTIRCEDLTADELERYARTSRILRLTVDEARTADLLPEPQ